MFEVWAAKIRGGGGSFGIKKDCSDPTVMTKYPAAEGVQYIEERNRGPESCHMATW